MPSLDHDFVYENITFCSLLFFLYTNYEMLQLQHDYSYGTI